MQEICLAITTATALSVPAGATVANIAASTAVVRYTTDGTTTPTSTIGMQIAIGATVTFVGAASERSPRPGRSMLSISADGKDQNSNGV